MRTQRHVLLSSFWVCMFGVKSTYSTPRFRTCVSHPKSIYANILTVRYFSMERSPRPGAPFLAYTSKNTADIAND